MEATINLPRCSGQSDLLAATTDTPPPPEVLARYGIFRSPPTEPVPTLAVHEFGDVAQQSARARTVDGVQVTVATILNWRPRVHAVACDAFERRTLNRLLRGEPSARVRARARAMDEGRLRQMARLRALPVRTLLYLSAPGLSPVGTTGALELSRLRGLYLGSAQKSGAVSTFAALIPDGVARIRFRVAGLPDVEAKVVDNIVVVRLTADRVGSLRSQQVWLAADGSVVRTIGKLR